MSINRIREPPWVWKSRIDKSFVTIGYNIFNPVAMLYADNILYKKLTLL